MRLFNQCVIQVGLVTSNWLQSTGEREDSDETVKRHRYVSVAVLVSKVCLQYRTVPG